MSKHRPPSAPIEVKILAWGSGVVAVVWLLSQTTTLL